MIFNASILNGLKYNTQKTGSKLILPWFLLNFLN